MPQMSPLLWGNLFIIFSVIFALASVKMYFNYFKRLEGKKLLNKKISKNMLYWLW